MKIKNILIICLIITCLFSINVYGQNPMSLYYMETVPQLTRINPAMQPRTNAFVALPSISIDFQSELAVRDLLQSGKYIPIDAQFDYKKIYDKIGKSYNTTFEAEVGIIGFGMRLGKGYMTFGISEKMEMQLGIADGIFKLTDTGPGQNMNFDFSNLSNKTLVYKQLTLGYSHKIIDELTVGANVRLLFGQAALLMDYSKFDLYTSREYWNVDIEGEVYSSLPITVEEKGNDFPDIDLEDGVKKWKMKDYINRYGTKFNNPGLGIDLGAVYNFDFGLSVSAALNNIGFIKWNTDLNSMSFKGDFKYEGPLVDEGDRDKDAISYADQLWEEIKEQADFDVVYKGFSTSLMPSLYVGASYEVNHFLTAGFLSRTVFEKNNVRQIFNLSGNLLMYHFVSLNLNVSQHIKGGTYLGLGLALDLGPLQVYMLADHLPLRYSNFTMYDGNEEVMNVGFFPSRVKDVSLMCGVNILIGGKGFKDRPMHDRDRR